MKRLLFHMGLLLLVVAFHGCSWVEYFVIINEGDKAIYVHYELVEKTNSFPVFEEHPPVYPLNSDDDIEWGKNISIADEDSASRKVSMAIPPRSALVFGYLHNSSYKSYDQEFINGRTFDLLKLQILYNSNTLNIIPSTFDTYFKKKQGKIRFIVE